MMQRARPVTSAEVLELSDFSAVLLSSLIVDAFANLGIAVSVWAGDVWRAIHLPSDSALGSELEHGMQPARGAYNLRCRERVRATGGAVLAEHAGFFDLFTPIHDGPKLRAILVAGPLAKARATGADLLDRYYRLTGRRGRLTDPSFSVYVRRTLDTLTLEGPRLSDFEGLMSRFARLAEAPDHPESLAAEALALQERLRAVRFPERMWEAARSMVDERTAHVWQHKPGTLRELGMKRVPRSAVVGLLAARADDVDPLDDLLRRDAFQRAAVRLATRLGDIVCGRVFDQGVTFLVDHGESASRAEERLRELSASLSAEARRLELRLHAGVAQASLADSLPSRFRAALAAAEGALSRNQALAFARVRTLRSARQLWQLRTELVAALSEPRGRLTGRFDRYIEAVLVHSGYHFETTRTHLQAGFERLMEPLLSSALVDQRTFDDLYVETERAAESASSVGALIAPYRQLVAEVERTLQYPTVARQSRGMQRALAFMRDHLSERLTRVRVAQVAGFAPGYFSRLLLREHGHAFEAYLSRLRIAHAKRLLSGTALRIESVAQLSGFPSRTYFHRAFRASVGMTPVAFRARGDRPSASYGGGRQ